MITLRAQVLTRDSFAPFGEVIQLEGAMHYPINDGWAERYHDLAALDCDAQGGRPCLSIFRSRARPEPVALSLMERHPLSSQSFVPLSGYPFLVVVALAGAPPDSPGALSAFIAHGRQGVSYRRGVWHHPLLAFVTTSDFLVIDRCGPDENCDELAIEGWQVRIELP